MAAGDEEMGLLMAVRDDRLDELLATMPFAGELGIGLEEASAEQVVGRMSWPAR